MDILTFFTTWMEKNNDFTNNHIYSCVDIVEQFITDVLQLPKIPGNAIDLWNNAPTTNFTQITNQPTNYPLLGDIVIFNPIAPDTFGHCAIATISDPMTVNTFDQNWGTDKKCHVIDHTYNNVLGWIHKINYSPLVVDNSNQDAIVYRHKVETIVNQVISELSDIQ